MKNYAQVCHSKSNILSSCTEHLFGRIQRILIEALANWRNIVRLGKVLCI